MFKLNTVAYGILKPPYLAFRSLQYISYTQQAECPYEPMKKFTFSNG